MLIASKLGALGVLIADTTRDSVGDLSPSAAALLLSLHYHGPMTATGLAAVAGIAQPTAVRVLGGLAARGLVERGKRAGKAAPLVLTAAGRFQAETVQSGRLAALDRLLGRLAPDDRQALERLLDRILADATDSRETARTICRLCDHTICDGPDCPVGTRATRIEAAGGDPSCN